MFHRILISVLVAAMSFGLVPCRGNSPVEEVDALFGRWNRAGSPGAAVVVVKDGAIVLRRGYGFADVAQRVSITPETQFEIASLAKQFTGFAVATLVAEGRLTLADDVSRYVPEVPDFGQPITLAHLAYHTSGLRDWTDLLPLMGVDYSAPLTMENVLGLVRRERELEFRPGRYHQYSNTGYNLLAQVVQNVSGKSFGRFLEERAFRPLGMSRTYVYDSPGESVKGGALSYQLGDDGVFRIAPSKAATPGDSSVISTADDLGKWLLAIDAGLPGGSEVFRLMRTSGATSDGKPVNYGLGLRIMDDHGAAVVCHAGAWVGYRSGLMWVPDRRFGVAVLGNASDLDALGLARDVAVAFGALPLSAPKPERRKATGNSAAWDSYIGVYRLEPGWLLEVARVGDHLTVRSSGEETFGMTPVAEGEFDVAGYGAPITLETGGASQRLHYRGMTAAKVDSRGPGGGEGYAGNFWSDELQVTLRFEVQDGGLILRQSAGKNLRFLNAGSDRFDGMHGWLVEFKRDSVGRVDRARVSFGRVHNLLFTRR